MPASVPTVTPPLEKRAQASVGEVPTAEPVTRSPSIVLARRVAYLLLGIQLVVMLGFSALLYHRYDLTQDYAVYAQAWYAIAHGHLNPNASVFHNPFPFWQNHAEFVLWPLALLYFVFPHAIDLLIVQDLAVVGAEFVALWWAIDVLQAAQPAITARTVAVATVALALALVVDPWAYQTSAFDFHTQALATFFVVLAGRDLWLKRRQRVWWWVIAALLCNALAGSYIAAIGFSGLLSGNGRRSTGAMMVGTGGVWATVFTLLARHIGATNIATTFGYIVGHVGPDASPALLLEAILEHPGIVIAHIAPRLPYVLIYAMPLGLVGIFSLWALPIVAIVFLPSMLVSSILFIQFAASFQQWPALPFVLVGSVMVLVGIHRQRFGPRVVRTAIAVWAAVLVVIAVLTLPGIPSYWVADTPAAAAVLADLHASIAPTVQVVASQGIAGRFADRADIEAFVDPPQPIPILAHTVVFIMTASQGVGEPSAAQTLAAVIVIEHLGARTILDRAGIDAFIWHPHHQRGIVLP